MLVLSRRKNESIVIPIERPATDGQPARTELVEMVVVGIRGDKVRLGFAAPDSVAVHRREVYLAIQKQTQEAIDDPQAA